LKIEKIEIKNLHHRFDINLNNLLTGLNVVHAENGAGKTTVLHIIANLLNGDLDRFLYLDFDLISVWFSDQADPITIKSEETKDGVRILFKLPNDEFSIAKKGAELAELEVRAKKKQRASIDWDAQRLPSCSYFPAFRNIVEAWDNRNEVRDRITRPIFESRESRLEFSTGSDVTKFARQLFGAFVPHILFPTPQAIEAMVGDEIRKAQMLTLQYERELTSRMFLEILETMLSDDDISIESDPDQLFHDISDLDNGTELERRYRLDRRRDKSLVTVRGLLHGTSQRKRAIPALEKYKRVLIDRQQFTQNKFRAVDSFLLAVNQFYTKKRIDVDIQEQQPPKLVVKYNDEDNLPLSVLSSGERQILTLMFAASRISEQEIVLLDEPEISLHVDWQSPLLEHMSGLLHGKQIIVCTHSPTLASNHIDAMVELESRLSK
jgi:predicted ATP-binding protein involved in virulence